MALPGSVRIRSRIQSLRDGWPLTPNEILFPSAGQYTEFFSVQKKSEKDQIKSKFI
jgi:hypothetical protein